MKFIVGDRVHRQMLGEGTVTSVEQGSPLVGVQWDGSRSSRGERPEEMALIVNERLNQAFDIINELSLGLHGADPKLARAVRWIVDSGINPETHSKTA
jgi:hypothetical protein